MQEVKRIGVMSVAKISALFGIFLGLVMGILFVIASKYAATSGLPEIPIGSTGWSSLIVLPIFYGIVYFISGVVGAGVYNLFAKWVGGIKLEQGKK